MSKQLMGEKQMSDIPITVPRDGLFIATRTSIFVDDGTVSPCDGAFLARCMQVERRRVGDNTGDADFEEWWKSKGSNHRIENGYFCRDIGYATKWFIEITDIMDFVRKHGECVVSIDDDGFNCIEIYDYYRE